MYTTDLKFEREIADSFCIREEKQCAAEQDYAERLAYHRIVLVKQGSGSLFIDETEFRIADRSLFLIAKGQVCRFPGVYDQDAVSVSFGDCFWERSPASASNCKAVLFNNARDNQVLVLSPEDYNTLSALFQALLLEYEMPAYPNKPDALAAYLKIIMIKLANISAAGMPEYDAYARQVYRRFRELVSAQFRTQHDVETYARQMNMTARRLSELCKKCSGKGAKEIINGQLLAEAKRSLQFSALPVKEIAYELNFSTPEQFSNFFKKNAAFSPSDFRSRFVNIGR